jgi:hypothetical protein
MKLTRLTIVSSFLLCTAANLTAQRVETTYDHSTDFTGYRAYFWLRATTANAIWDQRVEDAVNSSLATKRFTQVPSGGQLAILASQASEEHQKLVTLCDGVDGGWGGGGFGGGPFCHASTTTGICSTGTLVVGIFDGHSGALLWRATTTNTLSDDSKANIKNLDKAVEKLLSHFPPEARNP